MLFQIFLFLFLSSISFTCIHIYVISGMCSCGRNDNRALNLSLTLACTHQSLIYGAWFRTYRCLARSSSLQKKKCYTQRLSVIRNIDIIIDDPPPLFILFLSSCTRCYLQRAINRTMKLKRFEKLIYVSHSSMDSMHG